MDKISNESFDKYKSFFSAFTYNILLDTLNDLHSEEFIYMLNYEILRRRRNVLVKFLYNNVEFKTKSFWQ